MQNLIYLLRKFSFIILFLFFEVVALVLIFRRNNFQKVTFLNSTNGFTGAIYTSYSNFTQYFYLRKENDLLAEENARLRAQVEQSMRGFYEKQEADSTIEVLRNYNYVSCRIVNNSIFDAKNYFTIDAGKKQGVRNDMGIISPNGIAGVVRGVSENFAVCISVLNISQPWSVRMRKSKITGTMQWDGKSPSYSKVNNIATYVVVEKGDTVETSTSTIFPEGIMVGTVHDFTINPDDGYYVIDLKLSTDFHAIRHVYAVDYLYEREQEQLEDSLIIR